MMLWLYHNFEDELEFLFSNQDCLEIHTHEECQQVTRCIIIILDIVINIFIIISITRVKEEERRRNAEECKVKTHFYTIF